MYIKHGTDYIDSSLNRVVFMRTDDQLSTVGRVINDRSNKKKNMISNISRFLADIFVLQCPIINAYFVYK